jgi:hypothetical protein
LPPEQEVASSNLAWRTTFFQDCRRSAVSKPNQNNRRRSRLRERRLARLNAAPEGFPQFPEAQLQLAYLDLVQKKLAEAEGRIRKLLKQ